MDRAVPTVIALYALVTGAGMTQGDDPQAWDLRRDSHRALNHMSADDTVAYCGETQRASERFDGRYGGLSDLSVTGPPYLMHGNSPPQVPPSASDDISLPTCEPAHALMYPSQSHSSYEPGALESSASDTVAQRLAAGIGLFLDCTGDCYEDFIKTELKSIHYVRDKELANLHLLITSQPAGNGGYEVTLTFMGRQNFAGLSDTMKFGTQASDTDDMIRQKLLRSVKLGLVRYAYRTSLAERVEVWFAESSSPGLAMLDPWDHWVFNTDCSVDLKGQKSTRAVQLSGVLSLNRITEDWKIRLGLNSSYAENNYLFSGDSYRSIERSEGLSGLVVGSLSARWSLGGAWSLYSSTYDNTKLWINVAPAIEYNIFPYSESTRRQCRIQYRIGISRINYFSETIYYETAETVGGHAVSVALDLREPWGTASVGIDGSQYLHDLSKNRLELSASLSFRIVEGLSIRASGVVSIIHDQLGLPRYDASPEEILLQRRELATTYSYYTSVGLSYTFGSIYSNIVNPRFGK